MDNHFKLKTLLINHMKSHNPPLKPSGNYIFTWTTSTNLLLSKYGFDVVKDTLNWVFKRDDPYKPNPPVEMWEVERLINKYILSKSRKDSLELQEEKPRGIIGNKVKLPDGSIVDFHWSNKTKDDKGIKFMICGEWYYSSELEAV